MGLEGWRKELDEQQAIGSTYSGFATCRPARETRFGLRQLLDLVRGTQRGGHPWTWNDGRGMPNWM
jgi:hypothetical protein